MSVLKYFKNISWSPSHRATGPKCNFFSSNLQRGSWPKKNERGACRPLPNGRQGPVAPPRATTGPAHRRGRGACRPPLGDRGTHPYICLRPPIPSSFEPENSTKNPEKKRGVRRREAVKPCRIQHL